MAPVKKQHTGLSRQRMYLQWAYSDKEEPDRVPRERTRNGKNNNKRDNKKEHLNSGVKRAARADDKRQQVFFFFFIPLRWGNRKPAKEYRELRIPQVPP